MPEKSVQDLILERLVKHDEKLDAILVQTTATNGRVTNHDNTIQELKENVTKLYLNNHNSITCPINKTLKTIYWVLGIIGTVLTGGIITILTAVLRHVVP